MIAAKIIICLVTIWILLEIIVRMIAEKGLETDFYGSISRSEVKALQKSAGLKTVIGQNWFHLGWIADPEKESYQVQYEVQTGQWQTLAHVQYGSWLSEIKSGCYRVITTSKEDATSSILGHVDIHQPNMQAQVTKPQKPVIFGKWEFLFKPEKAGTYLNDHCLYQAADGKWRIIGITSQSGGDYNLEKQFAVGVGEEFPPQTEYLEDAPLCESDALAWAPFTIQNESQYHLFWSPHKLYHMTSADGIHWKNKTVVIEKPFHKFFRDAMVYEVAPGQWLLYATGRGNWFSRIDLYQSFDLIHWQYIQSALSSTWGSERNFVTGSIESPFLIEREGRFYLSVTYNNESFWLSALLLQIKKFLNRKAYNNTLIFSAETPYNFGVYRGKKAAPELITELECHAPVYLKIGEDWYITTCGWPFAATITRGEAAYAQLVWQPVKASQDVNNC